MADVAATGAYGSILLLLAAACQGEGSQTQEPGKAEHPVASAAPVGSISETKKPSQRSAIDRAAVERFVNDWVQRQNKLELDRYGELYAQDFVGIKRVEQRTQTFDRVGWLADRRPMFQRDMRVEVSGLKVLRSGDHIAAIFAQKWSTSTFADHGQKVLTRASVPTGFETALSPRSTWRTPVEES